MKKATSGPLRKAGNDFLHINPDRQPLTPDKLRELSGWQVSDEEATEIIHSISLFCRVLYGIFIREQNDYIEEDSLTITPLNKAA